MLARVLGIRNGNGWFSPMELDNLFEMLHIPRPSNTPRELAKLAQEKLALRHSQNGSWSLTPLGRQQATKLFESVNTQSIEAELIGSPGSEFGHVFHSVIAPSFAPIRWNTGVARFLEDFPFEKNVFCMTRFPSNDVSDPVEKAVDVMRHIVAKHGLALHLASDRQIDDDLFGNVAAHMWACQYGIGIFEDRASQGLNYNLVIEIGGMLMTGRRCALFKDSTVPKLPTDFVGHIYKSINLTDLDEVANATHNWLAEDLQLGRCPACK